MPSVQLIRLDQEVRGVSMVPTKASRCRPSMAAGTLPNQGRSRVDPKQSSVGRGLWSATFAQTWSHLWHYLWPAGVVRGGMCMTGIAVPSTTGVGAPASTLGVGIAAN